MTARDLDTAKDSTSTAEEVAMKSFT